jgi:hypothetical protein
MIYIPIHYRNEHLIDCREDGLGGLDWLFHPDEVRSNGMILQINFNVPAAHPTIYFPYKKAHKAFASKRVCNLFGEQSCGMNPDGGVIAAKPWLELLPHILPEKQPGDSDLVGYELDTVGHALAHGMIVAGNELFHDCVRRDEELSIIERVGYHPDNQKRLIIALYIEPGRIIDLVGERSIQVRAVLMRTFLEYLFDGYVSESILKQWRTHRDAEDRILSRRRRQQLPFHPRGRTDVYPVPLNRPSVA